MSADVAPMSAQMALLVEVRRMLDRTTRWVLQTRGHAVDVDAEVRQLRAEMQRLTPMVPSMLRGREAEELGANAHVLATRQISVEVSPELRQGEEAPIQAE